MVHDYHCILHREKAIRTFSKELLNTNLSVLRDFDL